MPLFRHEFRVPHRPDPVFAWHTRPGAFERLTPSWLTMRLAAPPAAHPDDAELTIAVARGPVRFDWRLRRRDLAEGRRFTEEQVAGPFQRWVHTRHFEPDGAGGTRVLNEIDFEPPAGGAGTGLAAPTVLAELERVCAFRAARTTHDLALHERWTAQPWLTVAITGASGLLGTALRAFLASGGHRVVALVRDRERAAAADSIYWNPEGEEIAPDALVGIDAVVHLAAETLVQLPRWTADKKRRILESRVRGTALIARAVATAHQRGPRVLVSMSGAGYYGDRGEELLTEESRGGKGFLADVCKAWEESTRRARGAGVRVVNLRAGPVMSPAGGMLEKVLIPFRMGICGRVGSGRQYVPWINIDDMMGVFLQALMDARLDGPVNACAPNPVTNATFADILGRVLGRPTLVPVPTLVVKAGLGEMGVETLLASQRARPARLLGAGYAFLIEGLEESLRFQLGR